MKLHCRIGWHSWGPWSKPQKGWRKRLFTADSWTGPREYGEWQDTMLTDRTCLDCQKYQAEAIHLRTEA